MSDTTKDLESVIITMTCETVGAVIHYTLDGSEPTEEKTTYTGEFKVKPPCLIRARAYKTGLLPSDISEENAIKVIALGYNNIAIGYNQNAIGWKIGAD